MKKTILAFFAATFAAVTFAALDTTEDAAILRLPFAGIYQPGVLKVEIGSIGAATTASAFILSF